MSGARLLAPAIGTAAVAIAGSALATSWPELPEPPHTNVQWVAQNMEVNGVPMQVRTFHSRLSVDEMLAYFRRRWSMGRRCACVEDELGPYRQIARSEGRYFITVQVRPEGARASQGYIGITAPPQSHKTPGSGFPKLPETRVVNDIRADDGETWSRTLVMHNAHAPAANASFYETELPLEGWQPAGRMAGQGEARTLRFRRGTEEATLVFAEQRGRTVIGVTVVEHHFAGAGDARTGVR